MHRLKMAVPIWSSQNDGKNLIDICTLHSPLKNRRTVERQNGRLKMAVLKKYRKSNNYCIFAIFNG